jgi:hypothetical protein
MPTGCITYFNARAAALWGREPKLRDPDDRYCGSFKLFDVEGRPSRIAECWMALALREGRDFDGKEISIERPDGRRLNALAFANPLFDDTGQVAGASTCSSTSRRSAQRKAEAHESFEALRAGDRRVAGPHHRDDPDPRSFGSGARPPRNCSDGRPTRRSANPCRSFPTTSAANARAITRSSDAARRCRRRDLADDEERAAHRCDPSASPLRDAEAPYRASCSSSTTPRSDDAPSTRRRRRIARRTSFSPLSRTSCETRFSPIRNATEILRLRGDASPELQWALDVIDRQMQHMTRLVDDLLDISRITMNRLQLRKDRVEIGRSSRTPSIRARRTSRSSSTGSASRWSRRSWSTPTASVSRRWSRTFLHNAGEVHGARGACTAVGRRRGGRR